ncbi:hypothetical protein NIES4073_35800 [Kalymmatonema gypsitolerans NIES-4073]|nr:hypothetical protein NIES4073_35800 [Scytonema sp. NIES-4073]
MKEPALCAYGHAVSCGEAESRGLASRTPTRTGRLLTSHLGVGDPFGSRPFGVRQSLMGETPKTALTHLLRETLPRALPHCMASAPPA